MHSVVLVENLMRFRIKMHKYRKSGLWFSFVFATTRNLHLCFHFQLFSPDVAVEESEAMAGPCVYVCVCVGPSGTLESVCLVMCVA